VGFTGCQRELNRQAIAIDDRMMRETTPGLASLPPGSVARANALRREPITPAASNGILTTPTNDRADSGFDFSAIRLAVVVQIPNWLQGKNIGRLINRL
jgi:hypothetical protein